MSFFSSNVMKINTHGNVKWISFPITLTKKLPACFTIFWGLKIYNCLQIKRSSYLSFSFPRTRWGSLPPWYPDPGHSPLIDLSRKPLMDFFFFKVFAIWDNSEPFSWEAELFLSIPIGFRSTLAYLSRGKERYVVLERISPFDIWCNYLFSIFMVLAPNTRTKKSWPVRWRKVHRRWGPRCLPWPGWSETCLPLSAGGWWSSRIRSP